MDDKFSFQSFAIESRRSFIRKSEYIVSLSSMLDCDRLLSEDRDIEDFLTSECRFRGRELHIVVKCMSLSSESSFTIRNSEDNIEISTSVSSSMSFGTDLHSHAIFDSCRNIDIFFYCTISVFLPMTRSAFLRDFLSCATTCPTYTLLFHHSEYRLHTLSYSSASMTTLTSRRLSSLPMTALTGSSTFELDFATIATQSIFERYTHLHLDIFSDVGSLSRPSSTTSSEK